VSLYSKYIFPHLCDWVLGTPVVARHRKEQLATAGGEVLEIGVGTGLNLPHYPPHLRRITTVDPNPGMNRKLRRRVNQTGIEVDARTAGGESLPFADCTFDCVVSTFTLCSIADLGSALAELYRVLKPGGRMLFLEHGLSPDAGVAKWQRRLNRLHGLFADGCTLTLDVAAILRAQPFASVEVDTFYMEKIPSTHGFMYRGAATK
jgi:ubiquinone/menaquinone biosynthesis C-methylase UbiE